MLDNPVKEINAYCSMLSKKLNKLGIKTVRDLIFYYPTRYEDLSVIKLIKYLSPTDIATLRVSVESIKNYKTPKQNKKITEAIVKDATGKIKIIWFNQWYLTNNIKIGDELFLIAKNYQNKELISPEYEKVSDNPTHTGRIIPMYPLTYSLSQKQIRIAIKSGLKFLGELQEYLPENIIKENKLLNLNEAILNIHFPTTEELKNNARERMSFDELFFINLKNQWIKKTLKQKIAHSVQFHQEKTADFVKKLPFKLTDAQKKSSWEILQDITKSNPMNRLLNGDVGSGKTLVSALATYNTAISLMQTAILAPTEVLAYQHYISFYNWFKDYKINIALLTRTFTILNNEKIKKQDLIKRLASGEINIIIGTHAILQENIKFKKLALAIIDEQHRFGVKQRSSLSSMNSDYYPHILSMTATPIPRTLSLMFYGNLSLSILDQMPVGRKEIKTYVVNQNKRIDTYNFIKKEIIAGRQAFVICPLIDESDKLGVKSVLQEYEKLNNKIFPNLKIGMIHGKLKGKEKESVMSDFKANKINILVSTSVIEVGVDIPNATIIMIEGAERFGLSQLHQFRGRVGRGNYQSYCLLFPTEKTTSRLKIMENTQDGFKLAEMDLKIRGAGNIYGVEQSGNIELKIADINNYLLIKKTMYSANIIINKSPDLKKYPLLKKYLITKMPDISFN